MHVLLCYLPAHQARVCTADLFRRLTEELLPTFSSASRSFMPSLTAPLVVHTKLDMCNLDCLDPESESKQSTFPQFPLLVCFFGIEQLLF